MLPTVQPMQFTNDNLTLQTLQKSKGLHKPILTIIFEFLSVRRIKVDKEANDWMKEKLIAWQKEEGTGPADKPFLNEWYMDARLDCIRAGLITKLHRPDVVRSFVAHFVKKQNVALADSSVDVD